MTYRVLIRPAAEGDLGRLDPPVRRRVRTPILALANTPRPSGSLKLTGRDVYRLRVGDWRIVYGIDDAARTVTVARVLHRREVYRR